jgi:VIT1/CCC1 family predicted Fe2+/Mn2+ transporter
MIKVLRLQKAVYLIILGVIGLIAYKITEANRIDWAVYILQFSGLLFLIGAIWMVYPIFFAKKVNAEEVQLDPEKHEEDTDPSVTTSRP